jgi:hypothetical protein
LVGSGIETHWRRREEEHEEGERKSMKKENASRAFRWEGMREIRKNWSDAREV